jgi:hypothetical protein
MSHDPNRCSQCRAPLLRTSYLLHEAPAVVLCVRCDRARVLAARAVAEGRAA